MKDDLIDLCLLVGPVLAILAGVLLPVSLLDSGGWTRIDGRCYVHVEHDNRIGFRTVDTTRTVYCERP